MTTPRPRVQPDAAGWVATPRPPVLDTWPESGRVLLDVRQDIATGREPFSRIMATVAGLAPDGVLVLRAPFEPVPLYAVLGRQGLAHWTEQRGPEDWAVWFYRAPGVEGPRPSQPAGPALSSLDVRGLPPPLPLVQVLERLDTLAPGDVLEVLHDRRPLLLYPQIEDRGFTHQTDEPEPGVVRIRIRPGGPGS